MIGIKTDMRVFQRALLNIAVLFFLCCILQIPDTCLKYAGTSFAEMTENKEMKEKDVLWQTSDAYVTSTGSDARILIPLFADDTVSASMCNLIYSGLTKVDKDLNIKGDLAERWEISKNALSITFYLKKNVKWHDGEPFTAEDVCFTFKTILNPDMFCPYISSYVYINNIEVLDDYTIRFNYAKPYAPALVKFGMGIIPKHIFENVKDIKCSIYSRCPIGTGPYKFFKWESGRYIILEANDDYFEHTPGVRRYVYRIIPDEAIQFLELVSGGIDSMDLNAYQFFKRSDTTQFKKNINKYKYLARSYTYIGYNLDNFLFKDPMVRAALSYAINKNDIISGALMGMAEVSDGPFLKGTPYYDEKVKQYPYDPEKAVKLLNKAGWKDTDSDGVLEKDGKEFKFSLITNQGYAARENAAAIIQDQWQKIGVKAQVRVIAWSAFLDQFVNKKNFQAVILGWTIPIDPDIYSVWHTDSSRQGGLNFISYSNKRVDRLIEQSRQEFNSDKRMRICRKIHKLISKDAPYTFLYFPYTMPAVNKRFQGINPAQAGIEYNFIDWYVPENEVKYKF